MTGPVEPGDAAGIELIARGRYTEACLAIGHASLSTILAAEQWISQEVAVARAGSEPHRGYLNRLQLVRARRRRLQSEAQTDDGRARKPIGARRANLTIVIGRQCQPPD